MERGHEPLDVRRIDSALSVRDQRDGDLIHARILRQRPRHEERQLAEVRLRQALRNLARMLAHDMKVVEQPVAGRSDVGPARCRRRELRVGALKDAPRLPETNEEPRRTRTHAALAPLADRMLLRRELARALSEMLGPEQFAANRPRVDILRRGRRSTKCGAAEPPRKSKWQHAGWRGSA